MRAVCRGFFSSGTTEALRRGVQGFGEGCRKALFLRFGTKDLLEELMPRLVQRVGAKMKSLSVRRKHIDLDQALTAMSDPSISPRDALVMWRKALRRANGPTKELLSRVAQFRAKKKTSI